MSCHRFMMIHPSYFELMNLVNKDVKEGEKPVVTSRYSIVLGTAKRARQLVAANRTEWEGREEKPLSIAVKELMEGEYHIIRSTDAVKPADEEDTDAEEMTAEETWEDETSEAAPEDAAEEDPETEEGMNE